MNITKNIAVTAAAAFTVLAAGCGKDDAKGNAAAEEVKAAPAEEVAEAAPSEEAAEEAVVFEDGDVLVEAYGKKLTYGEAIANIRRAIRAQGAPEEALDGAVKQMAPMALPRITEEFVMLAALQNAAASANFTCTEEEVQAEFDEAASHLPPGVTLDQALERSGTSAEEIKKNIRESLPIKKFFDTLTQGTEATDEDVAKFYAENEESFKKPEQIRASHILVTVEKDASDEDKAAAKAKIEGLLAQVKEGADFAELAKANSDCPSKEKGGDLDWFGRQQMVPAFETAAFALVDGEVSEIVETPFGYHIIKKTGTREAGMTPLEEVKEEIKSYLENQKKGEFINKYMEGLREKLAFKQNDKLAPLFPKEEEE